MVASSRTVYGRRFQATPVWVWFGQRISGLLLGPLVAIHVWAPNMAYSRWLSVLLLAMALLHGYSGVRRLAMTEQSFRVSHLSAWVWMVVVGGFGLSIVALGHWPSNT